MGLAYFLLMVPAATTPIFMVKKQGSSVLLNGKMCFFAEILIGFQVILIRRSAQCEKLQKQGEIEPHVLKRTLRAKNKKICRSSI